MATRFRHRDPGYQHGPLPALHATYVLPIAVPPGAHLGELPCYLRWLAGRVGEVLVVDGSPPDAYAEHATRLAATGVTILPPDERTPMGKVGGVLTGVRRARSERVVVADDDVRYDDATLAAVVARLDHADVVRPANWFSPLPWHARLDTGRILLNRITGGDWPGTLAVRRSTVLRAGGYAGDVLFENLELVRTIRAAGGREIVAHDILVRRLPPTTAHFVGQRIRQAYDEWARPWRLVGGLAVIPLVAVAVVTGRRRALGVAAAAIAVAAEAGRRRDGGTSVFPPSSSLLAPVWVAERAVSSWLAVGARLRGGARYRDGRLRRAATPTRQLRRGIGPPDGLLIEEPVAGAPGGRC